MYKCTTNVDLPSFTFSALTTSNTIVPGLSSLIGTIEELFFPSAKNNNLFLKYFYRHSNGKH